MWRLLKGATFGRRLAVLHALAGDRGGARTESRALMAGFRGKLRRAQAAMITGKRIHQGLSPEVAYFPPRIAQRS
jgi:hypothetical protein